MNCPKCGNPCICDEADVGVGVIQGNWGCERCGWCASDEADKLVADGQTAFDSGDPQKWAEWNAQALDFGDDE